MKYHVYGIMSASVLLGEYEADSKEKAIEMAEQNSSADWYPSLCHQCARKVDLGDIQDIEANE